MRATILARAGELLTEVLTLTIHAELFGHLTGRCGAPLRRFDSFGLPFLVSLVALRFAALLHFRLFGFWSGLLAETVGASERGAPLCSGAVVFHH